MPKWAAGMIWFLLIATRPSSADEEQIIRFEANANRLSQDCSAVLAGMKANLGASPGATLVMLGPQVSDGRQKRLVAARQAVLDRQLAALGMTAEHREDGSVPFDGNYLLLALQRPAAKAVDLPPSQAPPPPQREWVAEAGRTLRGVLQDWASQAGWSLIWQSAYDYPLEASARLTGDFPAVATDLLKGFFEAEPPPTARLFHGNNVLIIQ
jgi:hypothetical protein